LNEHDCIVNWHLFGVFGARAMAKLCKFHPSDSFSPKPELQESIQCSYSSNSLRRPRLGLGKIQSRLGEIGSPKRGREETWMFWARHLAQARGFGVLSDKYARLGENGSPKRGRDETWCFVEW